MKKSERPTKNRKTPTRTRKKTKAKTRAKEKKPIRRTLTRKTPTKKTKRRTRKKRSLQPLRLISTESASELFRFPSKRRNTLHSTQAKRARFSSQKRPSFSPSTDLLFRSLR